MQSPEEYFKNNNPNNIPHRTAYILMFRFIAKYNVPTTQKRARSYLRHIGLGKQPGFSCPNTTSYTSCGDGDKDIDAFIEAANYFNQRVTDLDGRAKEIKDRTFPNPSPQAMNDLTTLQQRKEALVDETVALLRTRISNEAFQRVENNIQNRIKRLTRKIPSPPNPQSPAWRNSAGHSDH